MFEVGRYRRVSYIAGFHDWPRLGVGGDVHSGCTRFLNGSVVAVYSTYTPWTGFTGPGVVFRVGSTCSRELFDCDGWDRKSCCQQGR